jgi:superfamily II DNA helicase RecQ
LVPLSKLRDEQLDNIRKLNGSNPCLITAKSRIVDKALIVKIKDSVYIYVLLGPKQASLKSFRAALKSPELQARIRLIAINECYLVKQWETFRLAFTMIGELRTILR